MSLQKLQKLCDAANRRYLNDLNDDDQVKAMFDYESSIADAKVIISFDRYDALSVEDLKTYYDKSSPEDLIPETNQFKFLHNGIQYKASTPE